MHKDDGTILIDFSGGVVSFVFDISGKKSNLGSNVDRFVAISFSCGEMSVIESLVKNKNWILFNSSVDADNCPFIGFSTIETGGSNGNFLACNPIYWHRKSNRSGSFCSGRIKSSPGWNSNGTVHIKDTIGQTDALVTKQWEIRIMEHTMHSDSKLRCIWEFLCSDLHSTIADQNVMGVEVSLMIWITFIWSDDKLTFNNNQIHFWSLINIHVKVKTSWNMDRFAFHGCKLSTPSCIVRPIVDIGKEETVGCYVSFILDINLQGRRNITWSLC